MSNIYRTVGDVVSGQELIAFAPGDSVRKAAEILTAREIGAAPVVTENRVLGVFSERDILREVVADGQNADALTVADIMTPNPKMISANATLVMAFGIMVEREFRHLPVVDGNGRLIAMLSMRDIPPEHRIMYRQWKEWTVIALTG